MKKKKPNFSKKTIDKIHWMQNGYCAIDGCYEKIVDYHHKKSNSKSNNIKWPLFIQSIFNGVGLCRKHHDSGIIYLYKISDKQADAFEDYLYCTQHGLLEED